MQTQAEIQEQRCLMPRRPKSKSWKELKVLMLIVIALSGTTALHAQGLEKNSDSLVNQKVYEYYRERSYLYEKQIPIIQNLTGAYEQARNEANELRLSNSILLAKAGKEKELRESVQEQAQKREKKQNIAGMIKGGGIGFVVGFLAAAIL